MNTASADGAFIPVYVINLQESVSRREHMKREMAKAEIPFTFIEAVRGNDVTETIGAVTRNQTACALSHLQTIRMIAEGQCDFGAIFEDDVVISPETKLFLDPAMLLSLPRFDIMQLCNIMKRPGLAMTVATVADKYRICAGPRPSIGMQATIYSRSAAQRVVREITEISAAVDQMLFARADVFGLRIVSVRPPVIQHVDSQSTIFEGHKPARNKIWRELNRGMNCVRRAAGFSAAWVKALIPRPDHS